MARFFIFMIFLGASLLSQVAHAQIMKSTQVVSSAKVETYDSLSNFVDGYQLFNPEILKGQALVVRECEGNKKKGYRDLEFYSKIPEDRSDKYRIMYKNLMTRSVTPYNAISGHKYLIDDVILQKDYGNISINDYFLKLKDIETNQELYLKWSGLNPYKDFYIEGYYKKLMELYANKKFRLGVNHLNYNVLIPPPTFYDFETNKRIEYNKGDLITGIDVLFPTGDEFCDGMSPKMVFTDKDGKLIYIDMIMMEDLVDESKYQEFLKHKNTSSKNK